MRSKKLVLCISLVVSALSGCQQDHSEELTALQKQMGNVNRQIDEVRKQIEGLLQENQKSSKRLESLETQVEKLSVREVSPPAPMATKPREGGAVQPAPGAQPTGKTAVPVSCVQVWKLLGQGKSQAVVAQSLGTSVDAIRACEQKVGKGKGQ
jgi:TolA-binding protein